MKKMKYTTKTGCNPLNNNDLGGYLFCRNIFIYI